MSRYEEEAGTAMAAALGVGILVGSIGGWIFTTLVDPPGDSVELRRGWLEQTELDLYIGSHSSLGDGEWKHEEISPRVTVALPDERAKDLSLRVRSLIIDELGVR